ncbi:MAG: hypothetical protein AAF918_07245 [Pseudomonadota bacterium]
MLPTEPLSIGGVLDAGIRLYRNTFRSVLPLIAVAAVPYALANAWMGAVTPAADEGPELAVGQLGLFLVAMLGVYLALMFLAYALGHKIVALAKDEPSSVSSAVVAGLKYMLPGFVLVILSILALGIGYVLLIIPGLILTVSLAFYTLVPLMEERSVWAGLNRSHHLVWRGGWLRTAAVLTVMSVVLMALYVILTLVVGLTLAPSMLSEDPLAAASGGSAIGTFVVTWVSVALFSPLYSAIAVVQYNDLQLRVDGTDIESDLEAMQGSA